jgi:hypothetical protein
MVKECARICVLHDQILLSFADRITAIQHLSTSIAHAVRKHRLKPAMNLPEIPQSSRHGTTEHRLIPQKNWLPVDHFSFAKDIIFLYLRFQGEWHLLATAFNK